MNTGKVDVLGCHCWGLGFFFFFEVLLSVESNLSCLKLPNISTTVTEMTKLT